jgi:UDP-N-acetylmuramate dehydrogenase
MITEIKYSEELVDYLKSLGTARFNEPLKNYTTFQCGGNADILLYPEKRENISRIIKAASEESLPVTVIGGGSNLLVSDKGIRGIVLRINDDCLVSSTLSIQDDGIIYADASVPKEQFIDFVVEAGYKGIEFMAGIPGSIGGGIIMNAGTDIDCFINILHSVNIVTERGEEKSIPVTKNMSSYRSFDVGNGSIVTGGYFNLSKTNNQENLRKRVDAILNERKAKHPVHLPSAGSVFKNPEGFSSWKLVDDAGLKCKRIGGAMVSDMHTNFIVNVDNASSTDIRNLIEHIQETVYRIFDVKLETEIRMIGDFD